MRINLHIERLVLDGLPIESRDGQAVKAAVEAELARLLAESGLSSDLSAGGARPSVAVKDTPLAVDGSPQRLGHDIATAVYRGIGR